MGKSHVEEVQIERIRLDGGTQPRASIDNDVVDEYRERMEDGDEFPPVVVFYDGSDYWLGDGFHRVYAGKRAGFKKISADVRQGTQRDAILYSVGANVSHGMRRLNADKRRCVERLLGDDEWVAWSDRVIADKCGVSHEFVRGIRTSSLSTVDSDTRQYTTKHGTVATMNTAGIGKGVRTLASEIGEDEPATTKETTVIDRDTGEVIDDAEIVTTTVKTQSTQPRGTYDAAATMLDGLRQIADTLGGIEKLTPKKSTATEVAEAMRRIIARLEKAVTRIEKGL